MLNGKDVSTMTKEELMTEVIKWREMAPAIITDLRELHRFRQYGGTVEDLDKGIVEMRELLSTALAALEMKQQQLDQVTEAFNRLRADPLGVDRLSREQPKTRKLH